MSPRITDRIIDCMVHQTSFGEGVGLSETAIQLTSFLGESRASRLGRDFDRGGSGNQRGRYWPISGRAWF